MRKFVESHPKYQQDSVISDEIAYDLMIACKNIGEGIIPCPEILGSVTISRYFICINSLFIDTILYSLKIIILF